MTSKFFFFFFATFLIISRKAGGPTFSRRTHTASVKLQFHLSTGFERFASSFISCRFLELAFEFEMRFSNLDYKTPDASIVELHALTLSSADTKNL